MGQRWSQDEPLAVSAPTLFPTRLKPRTLLDIQIEEGPALLSPSVRVSHTYTKELYMVWQGRKSVGHERAVAVENFPDWECA